MNEQFKKALYVINKKMKEADIRWAVIGSANMALQGMEIMPRDLDIVATFDDLQKIKKLFSQYNASDILKLPTMTGEPAWEIKTEIEGVVVQFLGEKENGQYVSKLLIGRIMIVPVDNIVVPCLTLQAEARAYAETNRPAKAKLIKDFLKKEHYNAKRRL